MLKAAVLNWGKHVAWLANRSFWIYGVIILVFAQSIDYDLMFNRRSKLLLGLFFNGGYRNYNDGIMYFDYMLQKEPENHIHYFNIGLCYSKLEKYDLAVKYLRQGMSLNPDTSLFHEPLAEALKKLGETQEAEQLLEDLQRRKDQ